MQTMFLMTLLTLNDAGQLSVNFVETETRQACEQKVLRIEGIFKSAGITIEHSHCGKSQYKFSAFAHSQISAVNPFSYRISFSDTEMTLESMSIAECESVTPSEIVKSYCATSSQETL